MENTATSMGCRNTAMEATHKQLQVQLLEQEVELMKARVRHENALAYAVEKANA